MSRATLQRPGDRSMVQPPTASTMTPEELTPLRLAPIDLAELQQAGELATRVDRKYVVPAALVSELINGLTPATRVLQIGGARVFDYRSVYWDTPDLVCFHAAGRGRRRRAKVRSRAYLDTGASFLEVKTRGARGTTVKTRIDHPEIVAEHLDREAETFVDAQLESAEVIGWQAADLVPTLATRYHRMTLATDSAAGLTRTTFDTALSWRVPGGGGLDLPDLVIVETKGGSTPSPIDKALWRLGQRPLRLSKYGTGLRAIRTELPDLKWHRTLNRYFLSPA